MGWQRPNDNTPLSADGAVEFELDAQAITLPPQSSQLLNSVVQSGEQGDVSLCTIVSATLGPGNHTVALRVTKPGVYASISHVIWW